jgi:hypothetical protein
MTRKGKPNVLSNPNDDRYEQVSETEYWEWYYEEYEPYEKPNHRRSHDLEYGEMDVGGWR